MTRIAGDSSTFGDVPETVDIAMAYANGNWGVATKAELEAKYPNSSHVLIDVNGSRPDVEVRDWENGDKAGSLEQWVVDHNAHTGKKDAVVYCNKSTIPEVRQLTGGQILGKDYFLFVATLDGSEFNGSGVVACQKDGEKQTGGHWDRSVVYLDGFWTSPGSQHHPATTCKPFQEAVRATVDGLWGSITDHHAWALSGASAGQFPYGVPFAQRVVGTVQDDAWGPNSKDACHKTVIAAQKALTDMGFDTHGADGIWGPNTQQAFQSARKSFHI